MKVRETLRKISCFNLMGILTMLLLGCGLTIWAARDRFYYQAGKGQEGICELYQDPEPVPHSKGPQYFRLYCSPKVPYFPGQSFREIKPNLWMQKNFTEIHTGYELPCFSQDFARLPVVLEEKPRMSDLAIVFVLLGGVGTGAFLLGTLFDWWAHPPRCLTCGKT